MKIALLYLRILKKFDPGFPEHKCYEESSRRFLTTYQAFKPAIAHDLVIVNCGQKQRDGLFDPVATSYRTFGGGGFDCGTYQSVGGGLDYDLVVGLNTHAYFWKAGWLERIENEVDTHGPGLYAATASFQFNPHLRTPSIAFSPNIMRQYPHVANTRDTAVEFESGADNFSLWAVQRKFTVRMVTWESSYPIYQWRSPQNIFRRGDQSNCIIRDRHTDLYDAADDKTKRELEAEANG